MLLTPEQRRYLAQELLLKDDWMAFNQELWHLVDCENPDPIIMASLVLKEYLPVKRLYDRHFLNKIQKAPVEHVEKWLCDILVWIRANKSAIDSYQSERRWHANRRNIELNPRWKRFRELSNAMMREEKSCMKCKQFRGHLQLDHVRPVSNGGSFWDLRNVQLLCSDCNIKKSSTTADFRTDDFKKHVDGFIKENTRDYQLMLCTPEPEKAFFSSQPIRMNRVIQKTFDKSCA